jgi:signal transduction histidine kinase
MLPYDSLRERLVQPFLLLGFIVSATLSLTTFALLAQIEERAVERTLNVELESFRHRRSINPLASPAESSLLRGVFLPAEQLTRYPELSGNTSILEMRTLDDGEYSVLFAQVDGRPFALLYDRSYIKSNMASLALLLLLATAGMTLLSFAVGYRLSRRVVQPIVRLLNDVSFKAGQRNMPPENIGFSDLGYPPDEIGRLVRELDRFSHRLYEFVQRESYFAADVSHELRTPVAVISGAAEVLAEVPGLDEPVRQRISAIHRNAVRMSQVLEAMLILAKEERSDADPSCNLAEVVEDAVADCSPALQGRPVSIQIGIGERVVLPVERSLAYVLVSNVLRNACACTREGMIRVTLDHSALEIADTGMGIAEDRFPELLRRHAKGEGSTGHGLGLSIVARISERLRWQIAVESSPGQGTRFRFVFPCAVESGAAV